MNRVFSSEGTLSAGSCGNCVRKRRLYRASAGATPVVQCGVVQGFSRSDADGAVWCCTGLQQE